MRPTLTIAALLLLYYRLPLGVRLTGSTAVTLFLELVLVAALITWQVWQIRTSEYPRLRAIEALSLSLPLFLLVFAAVYFATESANPTSFSEGLTRTDALYFSVTVFASVGFGDITAVTQPARVTVMIQMIGDLFLVGIVVRVIMSAVQTGLRRHEPGTEPD
jgi:glucan phosphoethanolaminetransferase (alkaline phosphatase superfamily)